MATNKVHPGGLMSSLGSKAKSRGGFGAPYRDLRAHLFKSDRPRSIDRYIDYFGGNGKRSAQAGSGWTVVERIRETV